MTTRDEEIGRAVRSIRGDMPQATLAAAMVDEGHEKWSQSTVWSIEKGTRPLRFSEAESLAFILKTSVDEFSMDTDRQTIRFLLGDVSSRASDLGFAAVKLEAARERTRRYLDSVGKSFDELPEALLENGPYKQWFEMSVPEIAAAALEPDGGKVGFRYEPGTPDTTYL